MDRQEGKPGYAWYQAGIDRIVCNSAVITDDGELLLSYAASRDGTPVGTLKAAVRDMADGSHTLRLNISLSPDLPELPRVGAVFQLPPEFEQLSWYGRGLQENYPDRKVGYPVKVWESTVTDQYVPYILPQEHGAHCDTRWVQLQAKGDAGGMIRISSDTPFIFSALHTTPEMLDSLTHTWQVALDPRTYLSIDAAQRGLGTGACGPDCGKEYLVEPGEFELVLRLSFT